MKDTQSIRKILFLSKTDIALIVFDMVEGQKNILFAKQVNLSGAELNVKINELLTNAANFLNFNIKEVEIIFDDPEIEKVTCKDEFPDCNNEEEIVKGIYKFARPHNHYVNEITFNNIVYDDIEKKAIVDYEIVTSVYTTYKNFITAVKQCNLNILESTNLYTLLGSNKASNQLILKIKDGNVIGSEYNNAKLNDVINLDVSLNEVYTALANKYDQSVNSIKQMVNIINNIDADLQTETLVSLNFDFIHRKFSGIKAKELIESYQAEINYLLSSKFDFNAYSDVSVITNQAINKLTNANVIQPEEIIGLDYIENDKVIALANIDVNVKANTQFKFENTINTKVHTIVA